MCVNFRTFTLQYKKKNTQFLKTYFCRKKRTAVFSFKKRTKYGKNVLLGSSATWLLTIYYWDVRARMHQTSNTDRQTNKWKDECLPLSLSCSLCAIWGLAPPPSMESGLSTPPPGIPGIRLHTKAQVINQANIQCTKTIFMYRNLILFKRNKNGL